jgi:hypothetical protein
LASFGICTVRAMALVARPFGASQNQLPVVSSAPLRRCTFRRVTAVHATEARPASYEVACMFPDRKRPVPLGDIGRARPVCAACTYQGIFRADSD